MKQLHAAGTEEMFPHSDEVKVVLRFPTKEGLRATTLRKVDGYIPCDIALEDKCGIGNHPLLEFGPLHS